MEMGYVSCGGAERLNGFSIGAWRASRPKRNLVVSIRVYPDGEVYRDKTRNTLSHADFVRYVVIGFVVARETVVFR